MKAIPRSAAVARAVWLRQSAGPGIDRTHLAPSPSKHCGLREVLGFRAEGPSERIESGTRLCVEAHLVDCSQSTAVPSPL